MPTEVQLAMRERMAAAARVTGTRQIVYTSEWLGYMPFGVYHWVDCHSERISDDFPPQWTRDDLAALEQQGFLRLLSDWKDPADEYHQITTYELPMA